jgi:3-(3-hydroxy-phenyl)propionate hydroxylase
MSRIFRDAVLSLAEAHPFARRFVNSGRLSTATTLADSPLNTPDAERFDGSMVPGAAATDAPIVVEGTRDWFLHRLGGRFVAVHFAADAANDATAAFVSTFGVDTDPALRNVGALVVERSAGASASGLPVVTDVEGLVATRYDATPGTTYLFRPDQHVCARWRGFDASRLRAALARATCTG